VRFLIQEDWPDAQREELFCDFFGVYALGPAYAQFMIMYRLDPSEAAPNLPFPNPEAAEATHPTPDKRVAVMLHTLARLNQATGRVASPHAPAMDRMSVEWRKQTGSDDVVDPETDERLRHLVGRMWGDLDPVLDCRFSPLMGASAMADALRGGIRPSLTRNLRVLDVVAAAWRARTFPHVPDRDTIAGISERGLALCRGIILRATEPGGHV
jgi:hypothetical protein